MSGGQAPGRAGVLYGALERTGTYTVTVSAPGYRTWTQANVAVTRGGRCDSLRRVELTARLQPVPPAAGRRGERSAPTG